MSTWYKTSELVFFDCDLKRWIYLSYLRLSMHVEWEFARFLVFFACFKFIAYTFTAVAPTTPFYQLELVNSSHEMWWLYSSMLILSNHSQKTQFESCIWGWHVLWFCVTYVTLRTLQISGGLFGLKMNCFGLFLCCSWFRRVFWLLIRDLMILKGQPPLLQ